MKKRILSGILTFAMVCQLMSGISFAAEEQSATESLTEESTAEESEVEESTAEESEAEESTVEESAAEETVYVELDTKYIFQEGGLSVYGSDKDSDEELISPLADIDKQKLADTLYQGLKEKVESIDIS